MNSSSQGSGSSANKATVIITVNSTTGALTITHNNCTESTASDNPIANWTKTTYTPNGGTITISVEAKQDDNTKGLEAAIGDEKNNVEELYHYKKNAHEVLKLRKNTRYYIYYYNSNNNWTKLSSSNANDVDSDAQDSGVINDELSNRVEIQLEKDTTSTAYIQFDHSTDNNVTVGNADTNITGYIGYKHTIAGGLKIEKISHNGNLITGQWSTPISNVTKFWVFYEESDTTRSKPLILCYNSGDNWYNRGVKWRTATELSSITVPTATLSSIANDASNKTTVTSKLNVMTRLGPGNYGQFVDKNGVDAIDFVLSKLKEAEDKVKTAINVLTTQPEQSTQAAKANKGKLNRVKTKIGIARERVTAIMTGADFRYLTTEAGKGGAAKADLERVSTEANAQLSTAIPYGNSDRITKDDIKTPINDAIGKFTNAATDGVGNYTTHKDPTNSKNWNICSHDPREWLYSLEIGNWRKAPRLVEERLQPYLHTRLGSLPYLLLITTPIDFFWVF